MTRPVMRIAIVNGHAAGMSLLRGAVVSQPGWRVAWEAEHGDDAIRLCAEDTPDLILMDLLMPGANGVRATRAIMAANPCPILVVTTGADVDAPQAFEALAAGALDVVDCPASSGLADLNALVAKIQVIARLAGLSRRPRQSRTVVPGRTIDPSSLVAIGASAGGPAALRQLLDELPATFPAPLVITQHLDEKFAAGMARWLSLPGRLPVEVARHGDRPEAGRVLLAGTNDHLVLREDGRLTYTDEPVDQPYRPSVDEFFASAALHWPGPIIGVLLTGMGQDGARGLLALRRLGHTTFAQDQESSVVHGMPGTAVRFGAAMAQMNPSAIGRELAAMARTTHFARLQPKDM